MKPDSLTVKDGVVLIEIMRRKAAANNRLLGTDSWTPRKIDKVLWTYGRNPGPSPSPPRQHRIRRS